MDRVFKVKENGSIATLKGIAYGGNTVSEKDIPAKKRADRIKKLLASKMISEVKEKKGKE